MSSVPVYAVAADQTAQVSKSDNTMTVAGVVTDQSDGEPLVGVTVMVKGSSIGGQTDIDGRFRLGNVPRGATVKFSYIGMEPAAALGSCGCRYEQDGQASVYRCYFKARWRKSENGRCA